MSKSVPVKGTGAGRAGNPHKLPPEPAQDGLPAIDPAMLSHDALRAHFARGDVDWRPEIVNDSAWGDVVEPRPAAVLVPLIRGVDGAEVLLTTRPAHLRSHSGQIAFPGGRADKTDADRTFTALREAHEEVGLVAHQIDVIGQLPEYQTGSGFAVTAVVGLIESDPALTLEPNEVEEVFRVPLAFLMDPANHQRRRYNYEGRDRVFYAMPWRSESPQVEYFIWGVTAAILRNLYHYLRAGQGS